MTTLHLRKSIGLSPLRRGFLLIPLMLICFGLSPDARAVVPPPDGGYPGHNTAEGDTALFSLTTGSANTGLGFQTLFSNTDGDQNTAVGSEALYSNTTGGINTATGVQALYSNTTGTGNTANGISALLSNTTGSFNTATGGSALARNTTGSVNTATGVQALFNNTTGRENTANGFNTLVFNTTGLGNTASGAEALFRNTTGSRNTANGLGALNSNTTGSSNTASGVTALELNTTGRFNTANGAIALLSNTTGNGNTANGAQTLLSNTTGSSNIALGFAAGSALTTGSNNIDIGNAGVAAETNTIRIGTQGTQTATFMAGISGTALGGGVAVRVNANGQLGTVGSAARFKQNIKPMDKASEAIHALKPVTFRYRDELDPEGTPQFGLVAEEVEKVNPDLVARDKEGKVYTVRYDQINAMLLNEFLKEHRKVEQLKKDFESKLAKQQTQIEALTAGLQKVGAQIQMSKVAASIARNNQ